MSTAAGNPYPTDRRWMSGSRRVLSLALLLGVPIAAQSPGVPIAPGIATPRQPILDTTMGFGDSSIGERQAKMLNIERQKTIVTDTERILQLARELDADANSDNPSMSEAVRMQKAEEIEKLAKTVREKMTYAVSAPQPANPYAPWQGPR